MCGSDRRRCPLVYLTGEPALCAVPLPVTTLLGEGGLLWASHSNRTCYKNFLQQSCKTSVSLILVRRLLTCNKNNALYAVCPSEEKGGTEGKAAVTASSVCSENQSEHVVH